MGAIENGDLERVEFSSVEQKLIVGKMNIADLKYELDDLRDLRTRVVMAVKDATAVLTDRRGKWMAAGKPSSHASQEGSKYFQWRARVARRKSQMEALLADLNQTIKERNIAAMQEGIAKRVARIAAQEERIQTLREELPRLDADADPWELVDFLVAMIRRRMLASIEVQFLNKVEELRDAQQNPVEDKGDSAGNQRPECIECGEYMLPAKDPVGTWYCDNDGCDESK